ncbi:unnamed protein product [Urochloa decumbens]|uniref:Uncharacterized protein n=1 Tax=Urochloa decumbens TaxID=240449 RepID=A0ABC9FI55_9POAL
MSARKRHVFSNKKKRTRNDGESSISDIWSQLSEDVASNLRRSVVSLVLKSARRTPFAFSGIAIERQNNVTKFVTTGVLVTLFQTGEFEEKINVHYEGNVTTGYLDKWDSDFQLAIVKVLCLLDVDCICLNPAMEFKPCKQLIAVGRVLDKLIAASGKISRGSKNREFLIFPTIFKNWLGAAFFDHDGNFVGMNHKDLFPSKIFLERSKSRGAFRYVGMNGRYEIRGGEHHFHPEAYDVVDKEQFLNLNSLGYPIPSRSMVKRGMKLVNTCEDPFGDLYPKGVWGEFRKRVSSEISRNVVALASFKGETRFFACTGIFIDYDDECPKILTSASLIRDRADRSKIVEGLRIAVSFSQDKFIGELKHYSLHYNVAVVSVDNHRVLCPVNLENSPVKLHDSMAKDSTVVAVGRVFQSGALMAASGKLTVGSSMLDCEILCYSTCKISKAGIGGPLVDVDGNFIGMNFHGMSYGCEKIGTPYLYREDLCRILEFLKTKKTTEFSFGGSVHGDVEPINEWPMPGPYWFDPNDTEEDVNDKQELVADGCPLHSVGRLPPFIGTASRLDQVLVPVFTFQIWLAVTNSYAINVFFYQEMTLFHVRWGRRVAGPTNIIQELSSADAEFRRQLCGDVSTSIVIVEKKTGATAKSTFCVGSVVHKSAVDTYILTRTNFRVFYLCAIKKDVGYPYATKKLSDTCVP